MVDKKSTALSLETKRHKPPRILLYGPPKIGKSTFGALADSPVFIQAEEGLDNIDAPMFPLATKFADVMNNIEELATRDHDRKTVVIDSLDWLEPLVWQQLLSENPKTEKGKTVQGIEDFGYGKGYVMALDIWREYLDALKYLRDEKHMTIIQIAHSEIKRFENPETEGYDRYQIKIQKRAAELMEENSEMILFANYYVGATKSKTNDSKMKAVGSGERILYSEARPSFVAGNRYDLPAEIPFDREGNYWSILANAVPYFTNQPTTKN